MLKDNFGPGVALFPILIVNSKTFLPNYKTCFKIISNKNSAISTIKQWSKVF